MGKFNRFFCSAFGAKPTNKLIVALREHGTVASTKRLKRSSPNTTTSTTTGNQRSLSTTAVPTDVTSNSPFHVCDYASTEYGDSVHHHSTHVSSIVKYLLNNRSY